MTTPKQPFSVPGLRYRVAGQHLYQGQPNGDYIDLGEQPVNLKTITCPGSNKPGERRTHNTFGCPVCNFHWGILGRSTVYLVPEHKQDLHGPSGGTLDGG